MKVKTLCTLTIFSFFVSIVAFLIAYRHPMPNSVVWWTGGLIESVLPTPSTVPFGEWVLAEIITPLLATLMGSFLLWTISSTICSKLRGED